MKALLAASVAIMIAVTAQAQPIMRNKPIQCAPPIDIINEYILPFELDVMYIAVAKIVTQMRTQELAAVSFWMNVQTGKFLMLEGNSEETCVLSLGDRMDFSIESDEVLEMYLQNTM